VVAAKKLIVGYTIFAPIAYTEGDGAEAKFKGFDIDLARAVVAYLNTTYSTEVELEFVKIDWNEKESMLENGTLDLVWNGMTITDERVANMAMSVPYLANKQVAVVAKKDASKYGSNMEEFLKKTNKCIVIVEAGSAGEEIVRSTEE
jgi:polar amino acid transport system substrate-binding protein